MIATKLIYFSMFDVGTEACLAYGHYTAVLGYVILDQWYLPAH